ncbi:GGDEF domain-containing protein [Shewanella schlegeliana]|uniref:diguanylate cyclase n=1 Tax=Shewanella schlegeliana TaxID=190308 RepID=A0ABS1T0I3_9GAMM|nr:GGDEF domain-containing protein [Shewanella schlegeliana]MBL4914293.1 GGDEF domain-containing protein [Shewanella schlegeliana]MCL1109484.1 GGDEF domain-containing protein [Shewanella schlegeliana]GIU33545.1 GGDEF domain-containing protein [Shewanella schlegeliana]
MDSLTFSVKHRDKDRLDLYKHRRVLAFILLVTLVTFVPLGIKNLFIGELGLGFFLLAFELSLIIEVIAIFRLKRQLIGYFPPLFLLCISIVLSIHTFGTLATYWVFPVVMTIVFMVPKKMAMLTNALIIFGSALAAIPHQAYMVTLRYVLALLICVSIAHVVIGAMRKLQRDLRELSIKDSLTGALNRYQMDDSLLMASENAKMGLGTCIALIDIDNFKLVNDLHGHDMGDKVIKVVVERINMNCRKSDLLFRLGGDEFLLLFDSTSVESAVAVAHTINNKVIEGITKLYPEASGVTLSIGIAESIAAEEPELWVKRADLALYDAKHSGRNQIKVYAPEHSRTTSKAVIAALG